MNCHYCGCELRKTNKGKYLCPNHGVVLVDEDSDFFTSDSNNISYIG